MPRRSSGINATQLRPSGATQLLLLHIKAAGLPEPWLEFRFHDKRKWRYDVAFPDEKVAAEIDGAVWTQGRHTRGSGYVKDMEKLNAAAELGWRVFRYTPQMVESGEAIKQLRRVLS